jgi:hypothetical protein
MAIQLTTSKINLYNKHDLTWWGVVIVLANSVICPRMARSSSRCRCRSNWLLLIEGDFFNDGGDDNDDRRFFRWSIQ